MHKVLFFSAFAWLLLLTGCGVTPMLSLPAQKEHFVMDASGDIFTGTWSDAKDGRTVTIAPLKTDPPKLYEIRVTDKPNKENSNIMPLPLAGFPVRYPGNPDLFFIIFADLGKVGKMAKTSELLPLMTRPYFYLVRAEIRKDGKLELFFVSWTKKENGKEIPSDPGVRLQDSLVINTTEELVKLLSAKKYVLKNQTLLERK